MNVVRDAAHAEHRAIEIIASSAEVVVSFVTNGPLLKKQAALFG